MQAGELNRKITIQKKSVASDADGYKTETWTTLFERWAKVSEIGTKELYQAQKLNAETSAVFTVRYTKRINARMRILYGNRIFEILGNPIDPDGKHIQLNISAKEVSVGG